MDSAGIPLWTQQRFVARRSLKIGHFLGCFAGFQQRSRTATYGTPQGVRPHRFAASAKFGSVFPGILLDSRDATCAMALRRSARRGASHLVPRLCRGTRAPRLRHAIAGHEVKPRAGALGRPGRARARDNLPGPTDLASSFQTTSLRSLRRRADHAGLYTIVQLSARAKIEPAIAQGRAVAALTTQKGPNLPPRAAMSTGSGRARPDHNRLRDTLPAMGARSSPRVCRVFASQTAELRRVVSPRSASGRPRTPASPA